MFSATRYIKWGAVLALALLVLSLAVFKLNDPDLMQNLANGALVAKQGLHADFCSFNFVPHTCQLAYAHQWLFNAFSYAIYAVGGWVALSLTQVTMVAIIFALIVYNARKARYTLLSTSIFVFLAAIIGAERFMLRADLLSLVLAVLFYVTLRTYLEQKLYKRATRSRYLPLVILFVTQLVWANSHGSFLLAFIIIFAYAAAFITSAVLEKYRHHKKSIVDKSTKQTTLALLSTFVVTLIASLANPFGIKLFFDAFNMSSADATGIVEWTPTFSPTAFHALSLKLFILLLILAVMMVILNVRKLFFADVVILTAFGYLSVAHIRFIGLFAIFCALILPYYLDRVLSFCARNIRARQRSANTIPLLEVAGLLAIIVLSVYLIQGVATNRYYLQNLMTRKFGFGLSDTTFPVHAANFIASNNIRGNMFNDYAIGEYLNWRLSPVRRTFIDGYTFSPKSIGDYEKIMDGDTSYNQVAEQYGINYFVLNTNSEDVSHLIGALYNDKKWKLIYFDELSAIFVADTPQNQPLIKKFAVDIRQRRNYDPDSLPTYSHPADYSYGFASRGFFLAYAGEIPSSNYQFNKAVALGSDDPWTYLGLGLTDMKLGYNDAALRALQKSIALAPGFATTHYYLGNYYYAQNSNESAIHEYKKSLSIDKRYQGANLGIGLAYMQLGDKTNARTYLQRELSLYPGTTTAQEALGNNAVR